MPYPLHFRADREASLARIEAPPLEAQSQDSRSYFYYRGYGRRLTRQRCGTGGKFQIGDSLSNLAQQAQNRALLDGLPLERAE